VFNSTGDFGVPDVLKRGVAGAAACRRRRRGQSCDRRPLPLRRIEVTMAARPFLDTRGGKDKYKAFKSMT